MAVFERVYYAGMLEAYYSEDVRGPRRSPTAKGEHSQAA